MFGPRKTDYYADTHDAHNDRRRPSPYPGNVNEIDDPAMARADESD
jgi:hypothetical protein